MIVTEQTGRRIAEALERLAEAIESAKPLTASEPRQGVCIVCGTRHGLTVTCPAYIKISQ